MNIPTPANSINAAALSSLISLLMHNGSEITAIIKTYKVALL